MVTPRAHSGSWSDTATHCKRGGDQLSTAEASSRPREAVAEVDRRPGSQGRSLPAKSNAYQDLVRRTPTHRSLAGITLRKPDACTGPDSQHQAEIAQESALQGGNDV
jgi:hypothetical protein